MSLFRDMTELQKWWWWLTKTAALLALGGVVVYALAKKE